jgi:hypothetical protein
VRNAQNAPETLFPFHFIPKTKTGAGVIGPCSSRFKKLPQHIQSRAIPEQGNTRAGQYINYIMKEIRCNLQHNTSRGKFALMEHHEYTNNTIFS